MDWKKRLAALLGRVQQSKFYAQIKPYLDSFQGWWEKSSDIIGLDIGQDSVKLLKIKKNNSLYVEYYASASLPAGAVTKDEIKDYAAVGTIIRDMFKQSQINTKHVAFAIPRSLAIIKNITIDSRLNKDEIESRAWIEANRHFPDLIGDIYLDFVIAGPTQDPTQLELTLVACRKDHIKPYLEIARQSGVTAKILDIDCYALERALQLVVESTAANETIALLNLDINLSTLIVVREGVLIYSHDQIYDGKRLTTQIEKYLNEKQVQDEGYTNILKENLISHLRHTIHFFYSSRPNITIQKIILSGDCATIPGLAPFIANEMGVSAIIADPMSKLKLAPGINETEFKTHAPSLMLCCGLALSNRFD